MVGHLPALQYLPHELVFREHARHRRSVVRLEEGAVPLALDACKGWLEHVLDLGQQRGFHLGFDAAYHALFEEVTGLGHEAAVEDPAVVLGRGGVGEEVLTERYGG